MIDSLQETRNTIEFDYLKALYELSDAILQGAVKISKSQSLARRLAYIENEGLVDKEQEVFFSQLPKGTLKHTSRTDNILLGTEKYE